MYNKHVVKKGRCIYHSDRWWEMMFVMKMTKWWIIIIIRREWNVMTVVGDYGVLGTWKWSWRIESLLRVRTMNVRYPFAVGESVVHTGCCLYISCMLLLMLLYCTNYGRNNVVSVCEFVGVKGRWAVWQMVVLFHGESARWEWPVSHSGRFPQQWCWCCLEW